MAVKQHRKSCKKHLKAVDKKTFTGTSKMKFAHECAHKEMKDNSECMINAK